mgnify:CR=1 FL=1
MTSWWVICLLVGGSLLLGWQVFTVLFTLISFIALKEYLTLAPTRRDDRLVVLFAYVALLVSYSAIWIDNYAYFLVTIPVYIFLATAVLLTLSGVPTDSWRRQASCSGGWSSACSILGMWHS